MSAKKSSGGADGVGVAIFVVIVLIAMIPKSVWVALGIAVVVAIVGTIIYQIAVGVKTHRIAKAAEAQRQRQEQLRREKQRRIEALGKQNAALVDSALSAVAQVAASEAARAGWLGDIDFSADIKGITDNFEKAHSLRAVTNDLSALKKPSADDRKIIAEARTTIANLERAAIERVELIQKCATEAKLIDQSLHTERVDAVVAEQRAELHAKLSAMLYGIEATPEAVPTDSAVEAVMARVQAFREIKNQIQQIRDADTGERQ